MADSNESDINEPVPVLRRRFSRLMSVIAVTSSCVLFVCAGCCFLTTLVLRPKVDTTAAGADGLAARIVDWTLPKDFSGKSACTADNPILLFEIASFAHVQERGHLVVAQLQPKLIPISDKRKQLEQLVDQYSLELKKIKVEDPKTRVLTVNGLPAEFQIGAGEDRASTTKYRQVIGHFRGKKGDAILILQFEDDLLTDQDVDDFLKSIR